MNDNNPLVMAIAAAIAANPDLLGQIQGNSALVSSNGKALSNRPPIRQNPSPIAPPRPVIHTKPQVVKQQSIQLPPNVRVLVEVDGQIVQAIESGDYQAFKSGRTGYNLNGKVKLGETKFQLSGNLILLNK